MPTAMNLDQQTCNIIKLVEAMGYKVEVARVKGRTTITATDAQGDEEFGMAATPAEAAAELLKFLQQRESDRE